MADPARNPLRPPAPVLFLLDEFAAAGRLEPVDRAMGLEAGYGAQPWPIIPDLHEFRATYGPHAGTYLPNAGLVPVFNANDPETADWVSRGLREAVEAYATSSQFACALSNAHRCRRQPLPPCTS